jgi:hypothetical protein
MPDVWRRLGRLLLERAMLARSDNCERAEALRALEATISDARKELVEHLASDEPLALITATARLTLVEVEVLAACVAADVEPELARLCQLITGSPHLTVAGVAEVVGPDAVDALAPQGSLARAALLEIDVAGPLGTASVVASREVSWFMLGVAAHPADVNPDAEIVMVSTDHAPGQRRVLVSSPDRVRRIQAAALATDGDGFLVTPVPEVESGWDALVRHATIAGRGIIIDAADGVITAAMRGRISRATHLSIAVVSGTPVALESLSRELWVEASAAQPLATDVEWRSVFGDAPLPPRRPTADQLRALVPLQTADASPDDVMRRLSSGTLLRHARRIAPAVDWNDLVLPPSQEHRLRDLLDRYRYRHQVHEDWKLAAFPSPGVVALFSGVSGTGKTMAAEVIAHELGVDLFRVDLAALVSKYIGETEKNLEEVFSAANAGSYVLLFDEADSLFGSRSKVTDARDRYANMEVSYLLQRLETYDGFVVLTSNLQGNIDPAFLRRIHATITFTQPGPAERAVIWRHCLASAPVDELDFDFIADRFDLVGGAIRNASLTAAFLAAARNEPVTMPDVLRATVQEMTKLGRRPQDGQLGQWAAEVNAAL